MQCLTPVTIRNPQYMSDHSNSKTFFLNVPCGHCAACLANRANQWTFRIEKELDVSSSAYFVTLTYDDDHLPLLHPDGSYSRFPDHEWNSPNDCVVSVCRRDVQLFMKRLRKTTKSSLKYFLTSEYGELFGRPHYHLILFNYDQDPVNLELSWRNGFVKFGTVTPGSIRYVTKYFVTPQEVIPKGSLKPFSLCSKGIGLSYLSPSMVSYIESHIDRPYLLDSDGRKVSFPRYFRKKLPFALDLKNTAQDLVQSFYDYYSDSVVSARRFNSFVDARNWLFNKNRKKSSDI